MNITDYEALWRSQMKNNSFELLLKLIRENPIIIDALRNNVDAIPHQTDDDGKGEITAT